MKSGMKLKLAGIGIILMIAFAIPMRSQTIKDISGNVYKTVNHGTQIWTCSNLNVTKFRNGDPIPEAKTAEEWKSAGQAKKPAWCYFNNDPATSDKFGKLYNWYAIKDSRGLTPKGWHVATNADWSGLFKNLTGMDIAGTKLKSREEWKTRNGTDIIGFEGLPAGYRTADGKFEAKGTHCQWWSNSVPVEVKKSNQIYSVVLKDALPEASYMQMNKEYGLSVRCVKDK